MYVGVDVNGEAKNCNAGGIWTKGYRLYWALFTIILGESALLS